MASEVREPASRQKFSRILEKKGLWGKRSYHLPEVMLAGQDHSPSPPETQLILSTAAALNTFKLFPGVSRWNKGVPALGVGGTLFLVLLQLSSQFCGTSPWCSGQGLVTASCMVLHN